MKQVLATGLSGLVGSRITGLMANEIHFEHLSREHGYDLSEPDTLIHAISSSDIPYIWHFAAYTDVQEAERERNLGEKSRAWVMNVDATRKISHVASETGKRLVYLSTDYVFDGTKTSPYLETDLPNPKGWYAKTKHEGELAVRECTGSIILRISNPYRPFPVGKIDWVHKIRDRLKAGLPVSAPTDSLMSPTYVDDIVSVLRLTLEQDISGIIHVPSDRGITPYDAACRIAEAFGLNPAAVGKTTYDAFYAGRAHVPKNGVLGHDTIDGLSVGLHSFEEGLSMLVSEESV